VEELLELYLYNDCYYEFEQVLTTYLRERVIPVGTAKTLIRKLDTLKRYSSEIKLINYLMANAVEEEDFRVLAKIKAKVQFKANEEFLSQSEFA
jgi:hypothetical protein